MTEIFKYLPFFSRSENAFLLLTKKKQTKSKSGDCVSMWQHKTILTEVYIPLSMEETKHTVSWTYTTENLDGNKITDMPLARTIENEQDKIV